MKAVVFDSSTGDEIATYTPETKFDDEDDILAMKLGSAGLTFKDDPKAWLRALPEALARSSYLHAVFTE